ncbi:hypothetical protein [Thiomicrorhabdus arctica]|uniref:hypothetical protein n=1 Tax=Thiomicrorhabdus arctica TaxID=131540 RepID=UPI0004761D40
MRLNQPNENISIHIVDIKTVSKPLEDYLDAHFISICEGSSGSVLSDVKQVVSEFLKTKDERTKMGATAEFFLHLYLISSGFKQECLFLNLEEGSIKKGFDGYYSFNNEEFIMESKSGSSTTLTISHSGKIKEAYKDLSDNLSGRSVKSNNNPWKNAYNHASHADVATDLNIRKNIKALSDNYDKSVFSEIKDFNVIPASTVFLQNIWKDDFSKDIIQKLIELSTKFEFKKLHVICITKTSLDLFQKYLDK